MSKIPRLDRAARRRLIKRSKKAKDHHKALLSVPKTPSGVDDARGEEGWSGRILGPNVGA